MNKKKLNIKTITCQDVYNFGASLQAFSLMKYLQEIGHHVQIINYKPDYLNYDLWSIGPKWDKNIFLKLAYFIYVVPKRLLMSKRREKFDLFTKNRLDITNNKYVGYEDLKDNPPKADLIFAGSDQIWNPLLPNGKDPSFFLGFVPKETIKASYAASFSVEKIPDSSVGFMKAMLQSFDIISVRERSGIKLLQNLGIDNGTAVLDPVYLLDRKYWEKEADFKINENEEYIFIYDQENNAKIKEAALFLSKKYGLKIYAIESLYPMSYADKRVRDAGPSEFLGLIKNSKICLTNSFHCISFSLIFEKEFYLFRRTHMKVNSRMLDLLDYLDLKDRIAKKDISSLNLDKIKYSRVNELLDKRRKMSYDFLDEAIQLAVEKKKNES